MPNWCSNELTVTGETADLIVFDNRFKQRHKKYDLESIGIKLKDYSKEDADLRYMEHRLVKAVADYPFQKFDEDDMVMHCVLCEYSKEGYSAENFVPINIEEVLNVGWFDWYSKNWGTRTIDEESMFVNIEYDDSYYYEFETAWGPAEPVIEAMAKQFPMLTFEFIYCEESNQVAGKCLYKNGIAVEQYDVGNSNEEFRQFMDDMNLRDYEYRCSNCGCLVEEYETDDFECSDCHNTEIEKI